MSISHSARIARVILDFKKSALLMSLAYDTNVAQNSERIQRGGGGTTKNSSRGAGRRGGINEMQISPHLYKC